MSVKNQMTALADAVRSKSGATGKLSIDKMITAINSISAGGGDVEYYKCAYLNRSIIETAIYVIDAGNVSVNGRYRKTGFLTPIGGEVWQQYDLQNNEWRNYYLYNYADNAWAIGNRYDSKPVLFDYYSTEGILGPYSIFLNSGDGNNHPDLSNYEPPPRVGHIIIDPGPDVVGTWEGYKAIWDASIDKFTFSKELTTRLPFSNYFTPEVGKIYPADTRLIVERLWQIPAGDVSGVSFSYYQCTAVYGPRKVDGFIVSGAGNPAVNGNYLPTDLRTEEDTPIYKHETAEYYYFEMWGEKGICTSPTDYPGNGLYYNMYDEGWYPGSGGAEPAPTVTAGQITVDADVPKTWSGYGVYWSEDEGYKFSETLTTCLSYGTGLTPELGKVYDAHAKVEVSKLFEAVKPITTNDTACLIYIDGTSLSNQGKAPNKHEVTFGSGVSLQNGYVNMTNDESGQILTTARSDGYGGSLTEWTWDYYFLSDANSLDCSGDSRYGWCIEGNPGQELYFRGHSKKFGVVRQQNQLVALSLQYDNGNVHVWNSGKYVKRFAWDAPNCDGMPFGIGCIADGDYDRMADNIKLFRFSNKARYVPGQDFELPEGFI